MSEVQLPEIFDVPLFRGLAPVELRELAALLKRVQPAPGTRLMNEGEPGGKLFVLLGGACRVVKRMEEGGEQELAVLEPPACFGEMSFFHSAPVSASIIADAGVEVLLLSHEPFESWIRSGSHAPQKLAWNTIAVLSERLRRMDEWTCQLVNKIPAHSDEWQNFRASVYSDWLK